MKTTGILMILVPCAACGNHAGTDTPAAAITSIGTTGYELALPDGWKIEAPIEVRGEQKFTVTNGAKMMWCRTEAAQYADEDALYHNDDVCLHRRGEGTKRKLPSGGLYADCPIEEFDQLHTHQSVAIGGGPGGKWMHCYIEPMTVAPEEATILESLRAKK